MGTDGARRQAAPTRFTGDLRATRAVVRREMIRFAGDGKRTAAVLLQAVLWLLVIGTGLGSVTPTGTAGIGMKTFLFPGVLVVSVVMTSMMSASSLVWDRESGFLREMLVAPVRREAIVLGKVLGGALPATAQGTVVLSMAGLAGVPYDPVLLLTLLAEMFLLAFALTAFGVMVAARISRMETFLGVSQMAVMPLVFLSGAVFPLANLPDWLDALTRVNPLSYAVDPMRRAVFDHLDVPATTRAVFSPGISWYGWTVPASLELTLLAVSGVVMTAAAIAQVKKID